MTVSPPTATGYVTVDDLEIYWESRGEGDPLVVVHGGFGVADMFGDQLDLWATSRRVIGIELQGHGHTKDVDRPFSWERFGDDIAGVIQGLDLGQADLLGYSLGGAASLQAAIRHPERICRLAVLSSPARRTGWYPDIQEAMSQVSSAGFEMMKQSPMYAAFAAVAPDVDNYPVLMDKTGALLKEPYDWSEQVRALEPPTLLICGDADSYSPAYAAEYFALLGGGLADAGWDGSHAPKHRLAIIPGSTHYDIFQSPLLGAVVANFFG
jgi:pimeloyl-ACP methyl ester carboxylesterase